MGALYCAQSNLEYVLTYIFNADNALTVRMECNVTALNTYFRQITLLLQPQAGSSGA